MQLENFLTKLQKVNESSIRDPIESQKIQDVEKVLNITFPDQIKQFYRACNGVKVLEPKLEILSIEKLNFLAPNKLLFAIVGSRKLYFDTTQQNEAEQWSIKDYTSDYQVTFTMASFWSNKVWKWINYQKPIWKNENS